MVRLGKYSYAFPGESDSGCVCQLLYLCVSECVVVNMNICAHVHLGKSLGCLGFSSEHADCKTCQTSRKHPDLSVYCTEQQHTPLHSILVSPLTFIRKCDAEGPVLGLFDIVFLQGQTNGTPWEGCRAPMPASHREKWKLKGELR